MVATLLAVLSQFCTEVMAEQGNKQRTFIMVKPDGVHRGLVGEILKRFEQRGYKLVAMKMMWAGEELLSKHYGEHVGKPFFPLLLKYIGSGPVVPMADKTLLEKHYADLSEKPFFPGLVKYMASGPVIPMVFEGKEVVKTGRMILGATNPLASNPGTIRGDFCIDVGRNICHGSDAPESAQKEIALWFDEKELVAWDQCTSSWVYE